MCIYVYIPVGVCGSFVVLVFENESFRSSSRFSNSKRSESEAKASKSQAKRKQSEAKATAKRRIARQLTKPARSAWAGPGCQGDFPGLPGGWWPPGRHPEIIYVCYMSLLICNICKQDSLFLSSTF